MNEGNLQMMRSCAFLSILFCLVSAARAEFTLVDIASGIAPAPLVLFQGAEEVYRLRVAFFRAGLTYSRLLVQTIEAMESYWRNKDDRMAAEALANWKEMERLCMESPYAINWGPVRPTTPRMIGLHPDYPNPKWKPNKANDLDRD